MNEKAFFSNGKEKKLKSNVIFFFTLQVHADEIKRNKEMLEKQKIEERNALNDKLKTAANLRDENIKRILDRLREHVSFCHHVKLSLVLQPVFLVFNVSLSIFSMFILSSKSF